MPYTTVQDVAARWRPLTTAEQGVAATLIVDAEDMILGRWTDVATRITSLQLPIASVVRVVATMVKRAMIVSPVEGFQSVTQGAGPFSLGGTLSNPNGNLYLSAEDVRLFDGYGTPSARMGWLA